MIASASCRRKGILRKKHYQNCAASGILPAAMGEESFVRHILRVAVRLPTEWKTCREVLQGVLRYAHERAWAIRLVELKTDVRQLLADRCYTGFIGTCKDKPWLRENLAACGMPVILMDQPPLAGAIVCDGRQFGRAAADFFVARGFRSFAFVGNVNSPDWSEERRLAFAGRLAEQGFGCRDYPQLSSELRRHSAQEEAHLVRWLSELPRPVGLFVVNDVRGLQVLNACRTAGIAVPQDVAVLSCDNDELICETSSPSLSSFQMTTVEAGYEAARALDAIMCGGPPDSPVVVRYGIQSLIERSSTFPVKRRDVLVERAMAFIRLNLDRKFTMLRLAQELNVSRRLADLRFRQAAGKSILEAILDCRFDEMKRLLRFTDIPVGKIIASCGFNTVSNAKNLFKKRYGMSMSEYRRSTSQPLEIRQSILYN